jgi:hypothetical protein
MEVDDATGQCIEEELSTLPREIIGAGWRAICCMMLLRTANTIRRPTPDRKMEATQKLVAQRWLEGGGVLDFEACCEALEVDPDKALKGIYAYAEDDRKRAINRRASCRNHVVFGKYNATHRQSQAAG